MLSIGSVAPPVPWRGVWRTPGHWAPGQGRGGDGTSDQSGDVISICSQLDLQNIIQEFQARGKVKSGRSSLDLGRRRSSAYSSDSDRSSWRLSGQFPDTRYSRLSSSDSRRDSETEMELVPAWLKLLRLHKYTELMMGFTYEEMIHLTEEQLEKQGVTKGARRKIITNIQKLLDRPKMLEEINMQLEKEDCNVKKVLTELEVLLKSPVKIGVERRGSYRRRQDSGRWRKYLTTDDQLSLSRDSGAEVSEDEVEEAGLCEGSRLVDLIMTTLRKTCSLLLLSPSTDVKNGTNLMTRCPESPNLPFHFSVALRVSAVRLSDSPLLPPASQASPPVLEAEAAQYLGTSSQSPEADRARQEGQVPA